MEKMNDILKKYGVESSKMRGNVGKNTKKSTETVNTIHSYDSPFTSSRLSAVKDCAKSRPLTMLERIGIIQKNEEVKSTSELAKLFNCTRCQINHTLRFKNDYLSEWNSKPGNLFRTRRKRSPMLKLHDFIVHEWITRQRISGHSVDDNQIRLIGFKAFQLLDMKEYRPSNRWLARFRKRFKIDNIKILNPLPYNSQKPRKSIQLEDIIKDIKTNPETFLTEIDKKTLKFVLSLSRHKKKSVHSKTKSQNPENKIINHNQMKVNITRNDEEVNSIASIDDEDMKDDEEIAAYCDDDDGIDYDIDDSGENEVEIDYVSDSYLDDDNCEPSDNEMSRQSDNSHTSMRIAINNPKDINNINVNEEDIIIVNVPYSEDDDYSKANAEKDKEIISYESALKYLEPLEQFFHQNEDYRGIGLLNQMENLIKEKISSKIDSSL